MMDDAIKKFLLKEYENVWSLYRANYGIRDRWMKFYFTAIGAALAFLGALLKVSGNIAPFTLVISGTLLFLFLLGLTVFFTDIATRFSRREMHNVFNFIRKAFGDNFPKYEKYMFYPTKPTTGPFGWRDWSPTIFVLLMVSINFGVLVWFFLNNKTRLWNASLIVIGLLSAVIIFFILLVVFRIFEMKEFAKTTTRIRELNQGNELKEWSGDTAVCLKDWEFLRDRYVIESIKTTLTLASGTLIVSLGIMAIQGPLSFCLLLYICWGSLVVSILLGVRALNVGILKYDRNIRGEKGELSGEEKKLYTRGHLLTNSEAKTPKFQIWTFVLGLLLFAVFAFLNMVKSSPYSLWSC